MDRNSVVGIATLYGLDVRGIESRWETRFNAPVHSGAQLAFYKIGTGLFLRVKRPGRGVDSHSLPSAIEIMRKSTAVILPHPHSHPPLELHGLF
jgi:hypothetical protein